jgi:homoserine O-acetyltransferase
MGPLVAGLNKKAEGRAVKIPARWLRAGLTALLSLFALSALAAEYPTPREVDWIARDFRFHTGEVMPAVHLHYTTIGDPSGEAVLVLHGTNNSGATMLTAGFAGELFGDGQALDAKQYFTHPGECPRDQLRRR